MTTTTNGSPIATPTAVLNKYSRHLTQVRSQAGSLAMLYGIGLTDEDMDKPQVGIASMGWEGNTCNMHLNDLATKVKAGVQEAGLVGLIFHTIGVSDGISMGTEGMKFSLRLARPHRRLHRDRDARPVVRRQHLAARLRQEHARLPHGHGPAQPPQPDGLRRHHPPRPPGRAEAGHRLGLRGLRPVASPARSTRSELRAVLRNACPGEGACGGMYTANTMASAIESAGHDPALQLLLPGQQPGEAGRVPPGRRRPSCTCWKTTSSRATS